MYYFLFFICIISRLLSTIYYIEDIDSLRFALSLSDEFNITKFQPHFPGYPVFCFLGYIFNKLTGSIAISFSLIGGISTFLIIYFSLQIFKINIKSKESLFLIFIIFFNPMIWILSNRYMPDLLGLSIVVGAVYYIYYSDYKYSPYIGLALSGLSIGVRLSYFPLLVIPVISTIYKQKKILSLASFTFGILIWMIPFIINQGLENLIIIGLKHTFGHFNDYGGTIITENNLFFRFKFLINTIFSDGLGIFWIHRHWITVTITILMLLLIRPFNIKIDRKLKIILISITIYTIWIFLFQNIIYKSRHVLPLVYFCIIFIYYLTLFNKRKPLEFLLIICTIFLTANLVTEHRNGTAIFKVSNYIKQKKPEIIISNSLVNYYLKSSNINTKFINIENINVESILDELKSVDSITIIGEYTHLFQQKYIAFSDTSFYHNPYMNRMWSEIPIYTLNNKID